MPISALAPLLDSASTMRFAGAVTIGDVLSTILICCTAKAVFPASSIAVHVIRVVPIRNVVGASLVIETIPIASYAFAVPVLIGVFTAVASDTISP